MFASCGSASRLSKADTPWTYEIESVGVGADGTYAIRVWSYYKNAKMPLEVAKRNAVHAVIFKGVPAGNGAASQPSRPRTRFSSAISSKANIRTISIQWLPEAYGFSNCGPGSIRSVMWCP